MNDKRVVCKMCFKNVARSLSYTKSYCSKYCKDKALVNPICIKCSDKNMINVAVELKDKSKHID